MKPLRIDFAPPGIAREIASMGVSAWLLAVLGGGLCLGAAFGFADLARREAARQVVEQSGLRDAARVLSPSAAREAKIPAAQASGVNRAIQQLNLPWSALLDAVERSTPGDVALLALEPDARRHLVKGVAEARNPAAMIAYIGRLKRQRFFGKVVLTRHEVGTQDTTRAVRFEFEAEWLMAGQPS